MNAVYDELRAVSSLFIVCTVVALFSAFAIERFIPERRVQIAFSME